MKKILFAVLAVSLILVVAGCGSSSHGPSSIVTQILSDPANDGDIEHTVGNSFVVTRGNPGSVFVGVDPVTGSEFRTFLDFPLTGTGGVPGNAIIDTATLDIYLISSSSIPLRLDLVSYPPQTLQASDYDTALLLPLATKTSFSLASDAGRHVTFDVTNLMVQAQLSGVSNFQIRILEDLVSNAPTGLIQIDDSTNLRAPLLEVVYH